MTISKKIIILFLLFLGLLCRLYKIDSPIADWHSFRQADTASVTRNFETTGIDLLHPTYHDLSNIQSGVDNPKGYRMVEFPIYNLISVGSHKFFRLFSSNISLETSSRLTSIVFSLLSAFLIFLIANSITHQFLPSLFSMAVFLFLPFNIYYSRTILPEPTAVFFILLSLYLFRKNIFLSSIFFALSILTKPYTALIFFPVFVWLIFTHKSYFLQRKSFIFLTIFSFVSLLPLVLWRLWIKQFPAGIPASEWLLNNSTNPVFPVWYHGYNLTFLNKLVAFRPSWFRWLFYERLAKLILAAYGLVPLILGFAYKKNHAVKFCISLMVGILLYFIIVAQGNIQHDYYQVLIIPSLSFIIGFGYYYLISFVFDSKVFSIFTALIIFSMSTYFSWDQIKNYYTINNPIIITAGLKANELLPKNALVIAPYNGDTAFLYQTARSGWPLEVYDLNVIKNQHPDNPLYLVSVNYDTYTNNMISKYPSIYKSDQYIILDLND
jgi:hypothetical protein